jgi:hypothetical protein
MCKIDPKVAQREVSMPRGPAPAWRLRKEPIADDYLLAAINQAGGPGKHDPATGLYATLVIKGFKDRDEAKEWDLSLYRCALWLTRNRGADISVSTKIERNGDTYSVRFSVHSKTHARAYILAKHGGDRSKVPYYPRRGVTS